jgi:CheY-like chemotaxis protein
MTRQSAASSKAKVLVIDDDEIALEATRDVLTEAGYDVQCLTSPIGAKQTIVSQGIEAVVVDLNMPVMSGDRFISLLRSWDRIRDIPTVLISGSSQEKLDAIAQSLPAVQTVTKENIAVALPRALERVLAKDKPQAATPRGAAGANPDELRALAGPAQVALGLLLAMSSGHKDAWPPLLRALRSLRDQARSAAPQLAKTAIKAVEVAEAAATRQALSPELRLAMKGFLEFVLSPDALASSNLHALLAVHLSRLERVAQDLEQ